MSPALLALLLCLPALSMGAATMQCRYGDRLVNPGETFTIEQSCARHDCTCDPTKATTDMCKSVMTGCLDSATSTCYKANDAATIKSATGSNMQCVCQQATDGSFSFANCRSETCKDSKTGEDKKKGESVTVANGGVTYVCTCGGVDGYQNCRTEDSLRNEGKCLDALTGSYVATGSAVTTKQGDTVLYCTCSGTNSFANCRANTCADVDGSQKKTGEKVTVKNGDTLLVCDCAGVEGYKNCQLKADFDNAGKCKDVEGRYADKGQRYRVNYGDVNYECTCDGNNSGKDCSVV